MKYVDEFRDRAVAMALAERIKKTVRRPWTIMEVCGGQTHAIVRFGLDSLLLQDLMIV
jgi:hydrogenase expression/formation protein HypD